MGGSDFESVYALVHDKLSDKWPENEPLGDKLPKYILDTLVEGNIPNIFKNLREKKFLDYNPLKIPNPTEPHAAVLISKEVSFLKVFPRKQKICLLLVPLNTKREGAKVYALVRKSQKEEFEKIEKLLYGSGIELVLINKDLDARVGVVADWLYDRSIRLLLTMGEFQVSAIEVKEVRKFIEEVSARMDYVPKDKLKYIQQYGALLVSKNMGGKGLFSKNKKICVLLVPREENPKNWSIHIFGFKDSVDEVNEIQKKISRIPNLGKPIQQEIIDKLHKDISAYELRTCPPTSKLQKKVLKEYRKMINQLTGKLQKFEGNHRNLKSIRRLLKQVPFCSVTEQELNELCSRMPKVRNSIMAQVVLEDMPQSIRVNGTLLA